MDKESIEKYHLLNKREKAIFENELYNYIQSVLSTQKGEQEIKDEFTSVVMLKILNKGLKNFKNIKNFISISFRNYKIDQYRKNNKKNKVDITYNTDYFYCDLNYIVKTDDKQNETFFISGLTKAEENVIQNLINEYTSSNPEYNYQFVEKTKEKVRNIYNYELTI